ncbi:MAG: hypothetical protein Ta2G_17800 [Termitinemataceae bacterium]|nr:MAG: hypothetical protein Ta2G_03290 [Termitinemataceae bacterium]GMO57859.1 MAG: hypothetical protein Ta2G_17800 [Termitinemataceae bacterium]
MAEMTDEEAEYFDELLTQTTPKLATGKGGFFTERRDRMLILDEKTVQYITAKARATHKTPAQLVADFVHRDLVTAQ